jgi:nucleoside 2-deoxyribosyltransferase
MIDKRKLMVYVAGPFRANSSWKMEQNIRRAESLALEAWADGYTAICPHANTRFYQHELPDDVWLKGDLTILSRCDAVLLTKDWLDSSGARAEVAFADQNGIPVFMHLTELNEWANTAGSKRRHIITRFTR